MSGNINTCFWLAMIQNFKKWRVLIIDIIVNYEYTDAINVCFCQFQAFSKNNILYAFSRSVSLVTCFLA